MLRRLALATIALAFMATARADDSIAALDAGGLVLTKTDKIALVSEDLFLSTRKVKIAYRFRNLTNADFETTIAFPMPDISGGPDTMLDIADPAADNFLKFTTEVDGKAVESQVEQRAFLVSEGKPDAEVTERLKTLHIPLVPTVEATEKAFGALNDAQRKALVDAGIAYPDDYNADDKGARKAYYPLWTLRSKFWRKQVFPAGKDVIVEQEYVPGVGAISSLVFGSPDNDAEQRKAYADTYCTDAAFTRAAQTLYKRALTDEGRTFRAFEQSLSYVITSGGNWAGPIGDFRLVVDKGDPKTLVSFCGEGVRKLDPTTFEMRLKNYVPTKDIHVLLLVSEPVK